MPKFIAAPTSRTRGIWILTSLLILLIAAGFSLPNTAHAAAAATPTPLLVEPRDTPAPEVPEKALLSEKGAAAYHLLCLPCHGDRGQGLTDEWRARFGPDQTCADCHASEDLSAKYAFPKAMPPLVGQNTLQRFVTARDLKVYIQQKMPWWDPGFMAESQAWELTAFLLRENGRLAPKAEFNTQTASLTPIHLERRSETSQNGGWGLLGLLGLGALALALFWRKDPAAPPAPGKRPNFFYHLHPPTIPATQSRFRYTLGMGGISVFLMLVLGLTGLLEMFFYIPTPQEAGLSIQVITFHVPFGALIRNLHFWSAQFLVVTAGIHLLRVVFTGAYSDRRRFNFLLGMLLFMLVFFLDFTGYILRWDEGIRWALLVGTNLLQTIPVVGSGLYRFIVGGETPGAATLIRFYAWHIFGLTLFAVILLGWHIFRVRRDGGIAAPKTDQPRITRFELVRREVLAMLLGAVVLLLVSALLPAPLAAPIQATNLALQDVRAPWFFLWVQQLLRFGDAFLFGILVPLGLFILLTALPYLLPAIPDEQKGNWLPRAGRLGQIFLAALAIGWIMLTILELLQ